MPRKELKSSQEAAIAHEQLLLDAMESGKWMAAVWKIDQGKIVLCGRTTWEFPVNDLYSAVGQLKRDCEEEINSIPQAAFGSVLPRACGGDMLFGVRNTPEKKCVGGCEKEETTKEVNDTNVIDKDFDVSGPDMGINDQEQA